MGHPSLEGPVPMPIVWSCGARGCQWGHSRRGLHVGEQGLEERGEGHSEVLVASRTWGVVSGGAGHVETDLPSVVAAQAT